MSRQDVEFLENYVLAVDRKEAIAEVYDDDALEYWYWNLLNVQNKLQAATEKQMKKIKKEVKATFDQAAGTDWYDHDMLQQMFFRQALIDYGKKNSSDVCMRLQEVCDGVKLDHMQDKEIVDVKGPEYPTQLQLSTQTLLQKEFAKVAANSASISELFTARACPFLSTQSLDAESLDDFLNLVETEYPDMDSLLDNIIADLENGKIFGMRKIHDKLTLDHLNKIIAKMPGDKKNPGILGDESFLIAYCKKLRPVTDVNLRENDDLMKKYLTDLKDFALRKIKDNHASLKACILFNHASFQEAMGSGYTKKVVQEYMLIPKVNNIYKPEMSVRDDNPQTSCTFEWTSPDLPELYAIGNDEPVIRRAMQFFFLNGDKTDPWVNYSDKNGYSLPLWAESMLVKGRGSQQFQDLQINQYEKSYEPAGAYKRLIQRVDLEFCPTNKTKFGVNEPVVLEFFNKNNPTIDVAVYDVNAANYYKENLNEIPVDLSLSGSITIFHDTLSPDTPPLRSTVEKIELKCLAGRRGVFIVDLVGNGLTTRALIRKGELRYIADQEKQNASGYVFRVFNEDNEILSKPKIWMDGKDYYGDDEGRVLIPFATDCTNDNELIILENASEKGTATLQRFRREKPEYTLECGMYIDREQLLKKKQARVIVRANLYMNDEIISLTNLTDIVFKLTLTDNKGNVKTRIEDFNLYDEKESVFAFTVPTELRTVECVLTCKNPGDGMMISKQLISVNTTDDTMSHASMYLFPSGKAGYVLAVRGKNGEGYPNVPVKLAFKHRMFREPIEEMVMTDDNGHVYLGRLPDIDEIDAVCDEDFVHSEATFGTLTNLVNIPTCIHRAAGTTIKIPFTPEDTSKQPILCLYDSNYIKDFSDNLKYADGYITVTGLPSGDFVLYVRDSISIILEISVSDGKQLENEQGGYVIGDNRVLQLSEDTPLQITNVDGNRSRGYTIKLDGVNSLTRVHVLSCAQNPIFSVYGFLAAPFCPPDKIAFVSPRSTYLQSSDLDSEYQYIVSRKHADKFNGNLLARPTMLTTGFTSQAPFERTSAPTEYVPPPLQEAGLAEIATRQKVDIGSAQKRREGDPASLEYLGSASYVYANKVVGEDGTVTITSDLIDPTHNLLQILAVDDDNTCLYNVMIDESGGDEKTTDVRLGDALDPVEHFTEVRRIICLPNNNDSYVIEDFSTAEYEPYETIKEPFNLYRSLCGSDLTEEIKLKFMKFEPLVEWDTLDLRRKLNFYDECACNEVNYFIYTRDEEFFNACVKPALDQKIQKTFFDKFLLGMDLSSYRKTHLLQKLNAFERVLLASVLKDDTFTQATLRIFREKAELEEVYPLKRDERFDLAIYSAQLGVEELEKAQLLREQQVVMQQMAAGNASRKSGDDDEGQDYLDMTLEYQDTGYYDLPVTAQRNTLIPYSRYWRDFAEFMLNPEKSATGFLSEWFMTVSSSLNEILCSMAVLGLPLTAAEPKRIATGNRVQVLSSQPVILFVRELVKTEVRTSSLSVSTNYFDPKERTHVVDGESVDKFITSFKTNKVYGCRIVVTNVSSVSQTAEILVQVPSGSIPCGVECFQTKSWSQTVSPYGTYRREFFFYFPEAGTYTHYPVHVNKNGSTIGYSKDDYKLTVEAGLVEPDTTSWRYLANIAEEKAVIEFLAGSELAQTVDLSKICWRFRDNPSFFDSVCDVLRSRNIYDERIWAYSIICDQGRGRKELGEFLAQEPSFRGFIYPGIKCDLVTTEYDATRDSQVIEFWPLTNPRSHEVDFSSAAYSEYYYRFLEQVAGNSTSINDISLSDKLSLVNYLLLRNLVEKAKILFATIDSAEAMKFSPMVYDYLCVYMKFYDADAKSLLDVAKKYQSMPLPASALSRWEDVAEQLQHRLDPTLSDVIFLKAQVKREEEAKKPFLDFTPMDNGSITIEHRNISTITIQFFRTELELMFSMYPFQDENVSYKLMLPNMEHTIEVSHDGTTDIELPAKLRGENTIVQMKSRISDSQDLNVVKVAYDNQIDVNISSSLGQLRVLHQDTKEPIGAAYVKVYAQSCEDRSVSFFKDGYTDVRGRFDFNSLSTDQLRSTKRLSILVKTDQYGSVIKEVPVEED